MLKSVKNMNRKNRPRRLNKIAEIGNVEVYVRNNLEVNANVRFSRICFVSEFSCDVCMCEPVSAFYFQCISVFV